MTYLLLDAKQHKINQPFIYIVLLQNKAAELTNMMTYDVQD